MEIFPPKKDLVFETECCLDDIPSRTKILKPFTSWKMQSLQENNILAKALR